MTNESDYTKALVDAALRRANNNPRNAIAYLLGRVEGAEDRLNRIRVALGEEAQETFIDVLHREVRDARI